LASVHPSANKGAISYSYEQVYSINVVTGKTISLFVTQRATSCLQCHCRSRVEQLTPINYTASLFITETVLKNW